MKTDFSLTSLNSIASVQSRHGKFAVDFSEKDTQKKLTLMYVSEKTKKLVPFAEIPVMKRGEVIKVINILGSFAKACERFENTKLNPTKLLMSQSDFVDLLTGRANPVSKKPVKSEEADGKGTKRRSLWE